MIRYFYLKPLRVKRHLTQVRLAQKSGVPQNCISRYERNRDANPPWASVKELARVLGVDPVRLKFGPAPRVVTRPASTPPADDSAAAL